MSVTLMRQDVCIHYISLSKAYPASDWQLIMPAKRSQLNKFFSLCFTSIAIVSLRLLRSHYDQTPSPTTTSHSIMPVCVCVCVRVHVHVISCFDRSTIIWLLSRSVLPVYTLSERGSHNKSLTDFLFHRMSSNYANFKCGLKISYERDRHRERERGTMPRADLGHWLLL